MNQHIFQPFQNTAKELLENVKKSFAHYAYDYKKHVVVLQDNQLDPVGVIRLPLHLTLDDSLSISNDSSSALYLAIESGNAAICVMEGEENVYHTTFSAYMVRKKQGFSQVKYLNKKGKSRAGSRIRLSETEEFFENINTTLIELFDEHYFDRIALSCSKTLIPYLFQSKVSCPFEKEDPRRYKIPLHLPQANFTNLIDAINKLKLPVLIYEDECATELEALLY